MVGLPDLSFSDWIEHSFGHEVRLHGNAWFFDLNTDWWAPRPATAVAYLTRLFEDPVSALSWFSDEQIAQGLTYLVSTSASGDDGWISSTEVPIEDRMNCIKAAASIFARLFAPRCTAYLSHLSEAQAGTLNCVCYMWWDEFPSIALPGDLAFDQLHGTVLETMKSILTLDSLACQESALHGLGHWQRWYQRDVATIIDEFLGSSQDIDPRLVTYANSARCGCVL